MKHSLEQLKDWLASNRSDKPKTIETYKSTTTAFTGMGGGTWT